jgi:nucleoside phosphorylase
VGEAPFRLLEALSAASAPVSGRALARSLGISPTTASSTLTNLQDAGLVTSSRDGQSNLWRLDKNHLLIASWLEDAAVPPARTSASARPQLKAAVFTALQLEYDAVIAHLPERSAARAGTTRFEVGAFQGDTVDWQVYVAEIGPGNVGAGVEVTAAVAVLQPSLLLFVGVAGSVKPADLCRGDVIVADRVYNLHAGKDSRGDVEDSVHLSRPISFPASHGGIQLARTVRRGDWAGELARIIPPVEAMNAKGKKPNVEIRAIAAGEVVHADDRSGLIEKIREQLNDVAAVDMESLGLYEAAHVPNLPALAVRGISDCVGDKQSGSDADWQPRAASHAAGFAFALLRMAEPEDFTGQGAPTPQVPRSEDRKPQDLLRRLPPSVALVYEWARPVAGDEADSVIRELEDLDGRPATWLSRFRYRQPAPFKGSASASLWIMVAEFADSHEHPSASWIYEQAADLAEDGELRAYLYSRAAIAASRQLESGRCEELLTRASAIEPDGNLLWGYIRKALTADAGTVLAATPPLVDALDLPLTRQVQGAIGEGTGEGLPESFTGFADRFAASCYALLEEARLTVCLSTALALQATGQYGSAQAFLERLVGGMPPFHADQDGRPAMSALVGPRSANVVLHLAKALSMRASDRSNREMSFDREAALARAESLALTARDRKRDWGGPTGDALAIAAQARAAIGDVRGALRLLLPPPDGTATRAESASQPVVRAAAEIAVGLGNIDLALKLAAKIDDDVERRLSTALALTLRPDSYPEAAAAYRSALADASVSGRADQQVRALLGLSMSSELSSDELGQLEQIDAEMADLIRARSFLTAGKATEAQVLARQHDSDPAIQLRVDALVSQGKHADAIRALENHASRNGGERPLLQAAMIALSADHPDEAARLTARVASSAEPTRRRAAHEILIDAASRQARWETVLSEARILLDDTEIAEADPDRDASAAKYRWAQAHALHQLRRMDEAYAVVRARPRLVPATPEQGRLIASILRSIAPSVTSVRGPGDGTEEQAVTQDEVMSAAVAAAQAFPDDEELVAATVTVAFGMPAADPADPLLMTQARTLLQQFFERFPESGLIKAIPVGEPLIEFLREQLAPKAETVEELRMRAFLGQIPVSACTTAINRLYAEALVCNFIGCYVLRNPDDRVNSAEVEAARSAIDKPVVVDTSALFLSPAILGEATQLRAHFERLLLTTFQRDDILQSRVALLTRSAGSLGWSQASQRPTFVEFDSETTERWAAEAERLAAALEWCDIVAVPAYSGDPGNRDWSSSVRAARDQGLSLLSDDAALRAIAREEGVAAFGSLQLLEVLVADGRLSGSMIEETWWRLAEIRAADLPLLGQFLEIAKNDAWKPTGYAAFLLGRPVTWTPPSGGWKAYSALMAKLPEKEPDEIAAWCGSALCGLCLVSPPQAVPTVAAALIAWTALEIRDKAVLPALLAISEQVMRRFSPGTDILKDVVYRLATTIRGLVPPELAARIVISALDGLDGDTRSRALSYFFAMP